MKQRKARKCKRCKKLFVPESSHQLYCTNTCMVEERKETRKKKYEVFGLQPIQRYTNCKYCGKELKVTTTTKFCPGTNHYKLFRNLQRRKVKPILVKKVEKKVVPTSFRVDGFLVEIQKQLNKFSWEAFKNNKVILKSDGMFGTFQEAWEDARLAFE